MACMSLTCQNERQSLQGDMSICPDNCMGKRIRWLRRPEMSEMNLSSTSALDEAR